MTNIVKAIFEMVGDKMAESAESPESRVNLIFTLMDKVSHTIGHTMCVCLIYTVSVKLLSSTNHAFNKVVERKWRNQRS